MTNQQRILLIDLDDVRRFTRIQLLENAGYAVDTRSDFVAAENIGNEADHDLVILALHAGPLSAAEYSDRLTLKNPALPILLLTDFGVFVPRGALSGSLETGNPVAFLKRIAAMLSGTDKIVELSSRNEA